MPTAFNDCEMAVQDIDGDDAFSRLVAVERLQQAEKEAHAERQGEDERQHRPPHGYLLVCVGGSSGSRGAAASAVSRSAW